MNQSRFFELNFHIPKLQLLEVFPLTPFLWRYPEVTAFDVGANVGLWSEALLKTHAERVSKLVMFEPMPSNAEHLAKRQGNVLDKLKPVSTLQQKALGDSTGEVEIHFDSDVTTLASVRNTDAHIGDDVITLSRSIMVAQSTVDAEMAALGIDTIHILKIDVEGYEMNVLKGAQKALASGKIKNVYFEYGPHQRRHGETLKHFFDLLSEHGFHIYKSSRGRNFFGNALMSSYHRRHEPEAKFVEMVLASRDGPDPNYPGPRVVGKL